MAGPNHRPGWQARITGPDGRPESHAWMAGLDGGLGRQSSFAVKAKGSVEIARLFQGDGAWLGCFPGIRTESRIVRIVRIVSARAVRRGLVFGFLAFRSGWS